MTQPHSRRSITRGWRHDLRWGVLLWLLIALPWLAIGLSSAWRWGLTSDESSHFGAGVSYWHYGDFRMNSDHPPLAKLVFGLPVYLLDPPAIDPFTDRQFVNWQCSSQYHYGFDLLYRQPDGRHRERLFLARVGALSFGLLGGLLAFVWGRELARHNAGGWAASALLMYYPEYAGHATLINYDVPMLVGGGAMAWAGWCWWRRPTWGRALAYAATCGVAAQIKAPVALLAALQSGVLLVASLADQRRGMASRAMVTIAITVAAGIAGAWAGALFRFELTAPGESIYQRPPIVGPYDATDPSLLVRLLAFAHDHRLLPEYSLATVAHLRSFSDRHQMLFGEVSPAGWRHYFLVTILFKTPLPLIAGGIALLAAMVARARWIVGTRAQRWRVARAAILAGGLGLMALMVMNARVNIGHRHILLLYFPWCVALGAWAGAAMVRGGAARWWAVALVVSQVATLVWVFPHHSTYVNVLGRSPYHLSSILTDSNVDWGEDLPLVRPWMDAHGVERINFAQFGKGSPEAYGLVNYRWITPARVAVLDPPSVEPPDPSIPSVVSLYTLPDLRAQFPALYNREPDALLNSYAVFLPVASGS